MTTLAALDADRIDTLSASLSGTNHNIDPVGRG